MTIHHVIAVSALCVVASGAMHRIRPIPVKEMTHAGSDDAFSGLRGRAQAAKVTGKISLGLSQHKAATVLHSKASIEQEPPDPPVPYAVHDGAESRNDLVRMDRNGQRVASKLCWPAMLVAAILLILLMSIALVLLLHGPVCCQPNQFAGAAETARSLLLFFIFTDMLGFTIVILDSYNIATSIGMGAMYSGWLIGITRLGGFLGCFTVWLMMKWSPELWRSSNKILLLGSALCLLGAAMFSVGVINVHAWKTNEEAFALAALLIVARFLNGLGSGLVGFTLRVIFTKITPASERPNQMVRFFLWTNFGLGAGPFLASIAWMIRDMMHYYHFSVAGFEVLAAMITICPIFSLGVVMYFPSLQSVTDYKKAEDEAKDGTATSVTKGQGQRRSAAVCCALLFVCGRAFSVAALEAGTALLLEVKFEWEVSAIGVAIGLCFMFSCIVNLCNNAVKDHISVNARVRSTMTLSVVGAVFMMPLSSFMSLEQSSWVLLVATCLVFSCFYMSDGILQGLMYNHTLPAGFFLDVNNVVLITCIVTDAVGRTSGPPIARWNIERGGQWEYAVWQLVICIIGVLLTEVVLFFDSRIKAVEEERKEIAQIAKEEQSLTDRTEAKKAASHYKESRKESRGLCDLDTDTSLSDLSTKSAGTGSSSSPPSLHDPDELIENMEKQTENDIDSCADRSTTPDEQYEAKK